jgi:hypothetical protein
MAECFHQLLSSFDVWMEMDGYDMSRRNVECRIPGYAIGCARVAAGTIMDC